MANRVREAATNVGALLRALAAYEREVRADGKADARANAEAKARDVLGREAVAHEARSQAQFEGATRFLSLALSAASVAKSAVGVVEAASPPSEGGARWWDHVELGVSTAKQLVEARLGEHDARAGEKGAALERLALVRDRIAGALRETAKLELEGAEARRGVARALPELGLGGEP